MFLLKDLPTPQTIDRFGEVYGAVPPERVLLFLNILRTGSDLLVSLDKFLATHGLTHGRWITLILLMREPDASARPAELAEKQGVTRATMTGLLQRLVSDALVERLPHGDDGRSVTITLTRKGRDLLEEVMPDYYHRVSTLMDDMNPKSLLKALDIIQTIGERADQLSAKL